MSLSFADPIVHRITFEEPTLRQIPVEEPLPDSLPPDYLWDEPTPVASPWEQAADELHYLYVRNEELHRELSLSRREIGLYRATAVALLSLVLFTAAALVAVGCRTAQVPSLEPATVHPVTAPEPVWFESGDAEPLGDEPLPDQFDEPGIVT